ncbi:class I SAM-dependent methyltransferase [Curtobacterium sp. Leaf261]|uniref:class I SAM-dependent methyltransferase n=1 Tax=Curtobacterium sp. Leaf261 TaxID=1736311 RepID=UPI0006FD7BE8|nr:methyltransferase domain-containing protein [Curtobacterium sp. Leaf261]KQO62756.1 SAM-dependent methyltransferase [Curtobacterium sp. Leaf261]
MTDVQPARSAFGAGGDEPYAEALRTDGHIRLTDPDRPDTVVTFDVGRWSAPADHVDRSLFAGVDGPVIDIGCGPGRMLLAAADIGVPALGIDVSPVAVSIANRGGGNAVRGSVFDPVPDEGHWDTALVIDGNIGIGGDPEGLLRRCRDIVRTQGRVVVETNPDDDVDRVFDATIIGADGRASGTFPWAEVGRLTLLRHAASAGLVARASWVSGGRAFTELIA